MFELPALPIDPLKTPTENIIDLINHTFPLLSAQVDLTQCDYSVTDAEDNAGHYNSKLSIDTGIGLELTGTVNLFYNRVDISELRTELEPDQTPNAYIVNVKKLVDTDDGISYSPHDVDDGVTVVTALPGSLLYVGELELVTFVPDPTIEDLIPGTTLDGFDQNL